MDGETEEQRAKRRSEYSASEIAKSKEKKRKRQEKDEGDE